LDGRRWSSHQPNVSGRGIVAGYSARFWVTVVVLGLVTGAIAAGFGELLRLVEHLAYGYTKGPFLDGVAASVGWRHFVALMIAAGLVILGRVLLGLARGPGASEVSEALWLSEGRLPLVSSFVRGTLAIVTVGLGSSLGRESAPQLGGAALASAVAELEQLPIWQRRLLVASGAGAGFAAIYNVPLGGALFALEVLLGTVSLPFVLPALVMSVTATAIAWTVLGTHPIYTLPHYALHPGQQLVWAMLAGPIIGFAAVGWVHMVKLAVRLRPTGRGRFIAPVVVFAALAAVSLRYPELLGNGKGVVQVEALGGYTFGLIVVLLALKPLATTACLGAGAPGGLFTPSLTIGVLLAGALGTIWGHIWGGAPAGSYAVIGGAAFLAAAMQGPLSGVVLMLELTRNFDSLMAPTLLAVAEATVISRKLGAPSIYSARLRPDPDAFSASSAGAAAINTLDRAGVPPPEDADKDDAAADVRRDGPSRS
jgi:chloride channel protein, CIC family